MLNRRWSTLSATALLVLVASAPVSAQTVQTVQTVAAQAQAKPAVALPDACLDAVGYAEAVSRLQVAQSAAVSSAARQSK